MRDRDIVVLATVVAILAILLCGTGHASELPLSMADPSLPCYATEQEAAQEALREAITVGGYYEAGGAIYRHGPLYCFTQPVSQGMYTSVDYRVGLVSPDKMTALYHTHPGDAAYASHLSTQDKNLARHLRVQMYVIVVKTRAILTYR